MIKKMMKDSFPTMISLTLAGMYSVIDGLFIGRTAGDTGLAAINIAWPVTAFITAVGIGTGTGGSVLLSYYRGKGDKKQEGKAYGTAAALLLAEGILLTILLICVYPVLLQILGARGEVLKEAQAYCKIIVAGSLLQTAGTGILPILRNKGMPIGAMFSMIAGLLVNIGINYYLMFEWRMGIKGAAYGTVAAQAVVVFLGGMMLLREREKTIMKGIDLQTMKKIFGIGITAFGVSAAPSITLMITNWQCLAYGGESAVACYAVISYIVFPIQYMLGGIGDGLQPLMSYLFGAGKEEELRKLRKAARRMAVILGAAAALAIFLLSPQIGVWFGLSGEVIPSFETGMKISAAAFVLLGVTKLNITGLNAALLTKKAMVLTYTESLAVAPLLLCLLPALGDMNGVWLSLPITAVCMIVIYECIKERKKHEKTTAI